MSARPVALAVQMLELPVSAGASCTDALEKRAGSLDHIAPWSCHHGDASTLLYQLGVEVPMLEYRFHLGREGA